MTFSTWKMWRNRKSQAAEQAQYRKRLQKLVGRRLTFERLEDRTLLSGSSISATQATALISGVQGLANFGTALDGFNQFAANLPVVDQAVGQVLNLQNVLQTKLFSPVNTYLAGASPTTTGLVSALSAVPGLSNVTDTSNSGELSVSLDLQASKTFAGPIDLGTAASQLGLSVDVSTNVTLTAAADFHLTFGFDKTAGLSANEQFFIRAPQPLSITATINAPDVNVSAKVGFVQVDIQHGTVALNGGLQVGFNNPDMDAKGNITLAELQGTTVGALVNITPSGSLTAKLPVHAKVGTFEVTGTLAGAGPRIELNDTDLFGGTVPAPTLVGFTDLSNFTNLTPSNVVGLLNQIGSGLQGLSSFLDVEQKVAGGIPFIKDKLDKVIDFTQVLTGFSRQLFDVVVAAPNLAPANGQFASPEIDFTLAYTDANGNHSVPVVVTQALASPSTNASPDDLVADINKGLQNAGIDTQFTAATVDGRLQLKATDSKVTMVTFTTDGTTNSATQIGFQTSEQNTFVFKFDTIQSLVTKLVSLTGLTADQIGANYDPASQSLTFHLKFMTGFDKTIGLDFSQNLSPLTVTGTVNANLHADVTLETTVGVQLTALTPGMLTGSADLPANGQLTGPATFDLSFNGNPAMHVTVPVDAASTSPTTLVADVNLALASAGLGSVVTASLTGNKLTLSSQANSMTLTPTGSDTGLHLAAGTATGNGLSKHVFLLADSPSTPSGINVNASIMAPNVTFQAALGFLGIGIQNGTAHFSFGTGLALQDPGPTMDGKVTLDELLSNPTAVPMVKPITVDLGAHLPIAVSGLTIPGLGTPAIDVSLATPNDPTSIQVTPNADFNNALKDFSHFSIQDVVNLLLKVVDFLKNQNINGLNTKLPLINKSVNDLLGLADKFGQAAQNLLGVNPTILAALKAAIGNVSQNAFAGDGSTTDYPLSFTPASTSDIQVLLDGTVASSGFSLNGSTLHFTSAPPKGQQINVKPVAAPTGADGTKTDFTLPLAPGTNFTPIVKVNGVQIEDFTVTGTTLSFKVAPASGATITVNYLDLATVITEVEKALPSDLVQSLQNAQETLKDVAALNPASITTLPQMLVSSIGTLIQLAQAASNSVDSILPSTSDARHDFDSLLSHLQSLIPSAQTLSDKLSRDLRLALGITDPNELTLTLSFPDIGVSPNHEQAVEAALHFKIDKTVSQPLDFNLNLSGTPVGLSSTGTINVDAGAEFNLDLGIDLPKLLSDPAHALYLRGSGTDLKLTAGIFNSTVSLTASLGAISAGLAGTILVAKPVKEDFTATDMQTDFPLTFNNADTDTTDTPANFFAIVKVNGAIKTNGTDFTITGKTLKFMSGLSASDAVEILYIPAAPADETPGGAVDGMNKTFTLSISPDAFNVTVKVNGMQLSSPADYSISGNTLTFVNAPASGATINVHYDNAPADVTLGLTNTGVNPLAGLDSSSFSFQIHAMAGGALAIHIPSGGSSIGALKVAADLSDFDLSHIQVSTPSGLLGDLTSGNFNLADMVAGLTALLHLLSDGLTSHVLASLPLIGNGLDKTGLFIEKILGSNFFMDLTALANPATLQADLQHLIFKYLGPGEGGHTGLDILADVTTGAKLTDFSQVGVTVGATSILVDLRFKGTDTLVSKNFGLGFDGLGLVGFHTMGQINVTVGYDIHFGFGLSKTDGFFFQLNTDNKPEIQLKLGVGFGPNTSITAKLFFLDVTAVDHGDSGFSAIVNLNIKDPNNDHKLTFKEIQASQLTDLIDTGSGLDGEQNPGDPGDFTGTGLGIDAKIDLDLQATINGDTSFPSLKAQLIVNWAFNTTDGLSGEAPHIQIKDVTLDFGTFLSKSIGPILAAIDSEIKPIKPLLDLLETKIPVISQLSELLGQGPVTFASAISALGEGGDTVVKVIHILDEIVTIADTATNTFQNSGELSLDFGNFSFGDATHDLRSGMPGSLTADQLNIDDPSVASGLAPKFTDVNGAKSALTGSKASQGASFLDSITGPLSDLGINLPLLSSPASIFKLFLGQDVDLVTWHLPEMKASFSFSYSFGPILPPIPLFVDLGGAFGIDLNLSVGLDTRGIRTGNFFNGFFFGTRDGVDTGNPQPVIDVFAQFTAGASLSIGVLSAGVDGGIRADIGASWHDPDNDGKLYIDELIANAQQGPECIFDLHGKFTAFLEAFVEVNLLFVHFRKDFTLVSITLFDFDVSCPPLPPPEPAHISDGAHTDANKEFDGSYAPAGVLVLNMGSHANLYQPGHSTDGDDTFKVVGEVDVNGNGIEDPNEDLDGVPGFSSHTVKVTGNGHDKVYTGVTGIYADGGAGKNKITLDASVLVPATLKAGDGGDVIQGGAADNHIYGGNGNDQLAGRDGNDTIYGGAGDDVIDGANGNNELHGGAGNDQLRGGTGNDTIYGDAGDDNIDGGAGDDHIYGGDGNVNTPQEGGNDQIKGGDGNDTIYGQGGPDNIDSIEGGAGADYIVGGQGNDMLIGDGDAVPAGMGGNDTIFGGTGNDTMIGGQGDNELHGGAGDDLMYGGNQDRSGTGNNLMYGDDGNDSMYGDAGKDSMYGGNNDDMMFAGPGNDYMEGGAGNDYMEGGAGNDKMIGGSSTASPLDPDGNDIMYGDNADGTGSGDDIMIGDNGMIDGVTLIGGAGNDQMFGGAGNDLMYGQGGDDVMQGGTGNDTMFGGAGNDVMLGQQGNDSMEGGAGSDVLQGGDNNDVLIGGGSDAAIASGAAGIDNANPDVGDSLIGGTGDDVIVGDNGNVVLDGSGHVLSVQTNPNFGNGPDSIFGGDGNDTIFGGGAGDNISGDSLGGTGNDVIIGDQGSLTVTGLTTTILARTSTVTGSGGDDAIFGSGGNDTILGGDGKDNITGDDGNDVILGDNGEVIQVSGIVTRVQTLDPQSGDNDTIDGGNGSDTVLGGTGSDRITGGSDTGNDILLGDNGAVVGNDTTDPTNRYNIFSTDPNSGGADTVLGGPGNEIMVGGSQGDSLAGNSGNDVIVGDNVYITRDSSGTVLRIATAFEDIGGNDTITTGTGADTAIGGVGDDSITGGSDTSGDILMGDNGVVVGNDGSAQANDIFSTAPTFGGSDTVNGGPGNDTVIGGSGGSDLFTSMPVGGDLLFGNAGDDIIIGDSAYITRDANYLVQQITTTFTGANSTTFADKGGNDTVQGGDGNDTILGGFGSDSLQGNAGNDVVLGDNGELDYVIQNGASVLVLITTNSPTLGADDSISGGAGNDSIMGGTGNDNITGDDGNDLLFGDHGMIDLTLPSNRNFTSINTGQADGGGNDTIHGNAGNDTILGGQGNDLLYGEAGDDDLIGGHNVPGGADGNDTMDGGTGNDVLAGDNASVIRRSDVISPLDRALSGTTLYNPDGSSAVTAAAQLNPSGAVGRDVTLFDNSSTSSPAFTHGDDYMAGGAGDDTMFGELGNDIMQGDGSVSLTVDATHPSVADFAGAGTDGNDYLEGNGGNDIMYGGLGQDDMIGGSSNLFGLTTPDQRGDGSDTVFGGAGTDVARGTMGDTTIGGHARDADVILGDNGNIYRIVGTNGVSSGAFLTFNYDNYAGTLRIIPRSIQLLDYTPGTGSASDLGAADLLHGEAGDDIIHGEVGNDVVFGEGQDDQLIGGAGNDRIYGGTGEDSILGDDGRFVISRNGLTEPLYGVTTANAQVDITLPGPFVGAWIYITGRINSEAHLLVPTAGGNDLIYGGGGDDFIHGGAGDDAISGAEAQAAWYNEIPVGAGFYAHGGYTVNFNGTAVDPNNPLGYDPTTRKLAAYDANNPFTKINNFFLNFDAYTDPNNQAATKIDDGKDRVFGDDGNDWLVGGTDNDRLFGGKGDDQINADDNLDTNGGLNNQPDIPQFADRDFVYGGDGLDVMIANTGGDRMFDWGGEFNTYLVPFSPFGEPTVYRSPAPHVRDFLFALGQESGADQTMTEPNGELGLFTQSDPQWQANHGGPRDPQAGNTPGTHRDTQGSPEDDRGTALPLALAPAVAPVGASSIVSNSTDVTLNQVYVAADPSNASQLALFVGGSNGDDTILVKPGSTTAYLDVVINGVDKGQFIITSAAGTIGRIIVYGNDGNDSITISPNVTIDAVLYGGAGNDTLTGGGGNSFMDGGDGNDVVYGGGGRDIEVGGLGSDTLNGGKGDDLLIGGTFKYSGDLDSVLGSMAIWNSAETYAQRIIDLRNGGVDGLFAYNLNTICDDGSNDLMYGNQGQDWFWAFINDKTDANGNEIKN